MHTVWWYTMIFDDILIRSVSWCIRDTFTFVVERLKNWYLWVQLLANSWWLDSLKAQFPYASYYQLLQVVSTICHSWKTEWTLSDFWHDKSLQCMNIEGALWASWIQVSITFYISYQKKASKTLIGTSFWQTVYLLVISIEDFPDGDPWDPAFPNKRSGSWAPHGNVAFPLPRHCAPWWRPVTC